MQNGKIVPVEITVNLILNKMKALEVAEGKEVSTKNFLIDGYPRNMDNVTGWERVVGEKAEVLGILYFEVPEVDMTQRILDRSKTEGRADDNPEVLKKRFASNAKDSEPIVQMYKEKGMVETIVGTGTVDEVYGNVAKAIAKWEA